MVKSDDSADIEVVIQYLKELQNNICEKFQEFDADKPFSEDSWDYPDGGGGVTRILENGSVFEKGGVNFSHIIGSGLPDSATTGRKKIVGKNFQATGVSVIMHPLNPFVPTCHMNVRFFVADLESKNPIWWFGGGYDLTPYYGFEEDCVHWHRTAKSACEKINTEVYGRFKSLCDEYFYIKHRKECRGIGGLFFDDFNELGFENSFAVMKVVGNSFLDAYLPIVTKRYQDTFNSTHTEFQQYRRGRYVEFNLVQDQGTLFGLQSNGRIESILMSMPPRVRWQYNRDVEPGSQEEKLTKYYLAPRDWAEMEI